MTSLRGKVAKAITQKLQKCAGQAASENMLDDAPKETKSQYFSPRKTRNRIKIEYEKTEATNNVTAKDNIAIDPIAKKLPKKGGKRAIVPKTDAEADENIKAPKWEPPNWKEIIENVKIMRKSVPAPVDTMGCDQCFDENTDEKTQRFHILVALMLSAQTKDQVTFEAMNRLKSGELTPENVVAWKTLELEDLLKPVSFYKNKAKYIQKTAQILIDEYDSDIPDTLEKLLKLPGVGPKMAHICMNSAWNVVTGIGVDVHVHRICNRLKWVRKPTKQPEETRVELESWLPSEHWKEVNGLLVGFGQTICAPVNPNCSICLNNQICPSAFIKKEKKAKARE